MKEINWDNLGFNYIKTNKQYLSYYKNGKWDDGTISSEDTITINASSTCLHYGQQAFEGLKAYRRKDGKIQLFRANENAKRFQTSCRRLLMPELSIPQFIQAVIRIVEANEFFVPPYETGATLYIRPYMIGVGPNIGVKPAAEYLFGIFVMPVGNYFKDGLKPVDFIVTDYDRAAPQGTGAYKVGGNYAASLLPHREANLLGFSDCIYLDPLTHSKIEEVGSANFFAITNQNEFVTPKSTSILPSITKNSLLYLANYYLNLNTKETDLFIHQLDRLVEAGACGTAAVITPIRSIQMNNHRHLFPYQDEVGPYTKKLYDLLLGIQFGDIECPEDWEIDIL